MHRRSLLLFTLLFSACGNPDDSSQQEESPLFGPRSYDHLEGRSTVKIGFGSCLDQDKSLSIFETVKSAGPDMFLMIGDNVYGDTSGTIMILVLMTPAGTTLTRRHLNNCFSISGRFRKMTFEEHAAVFTVNNDLI